MTAVSDRLAFLEAKDAVHDCVTRYLDLCDVPGPLETQGQIGQLFTTDATWEGVGPEYAGKFGIGRGRDEITALVTRYLPPATHFVRNVHLLGSEQIRIDDDDARGCWIMQQLSLYADGTAELSCARLEIDFEVQYMRDTTTARMRRFRTQRMFATPLPADAMSVLH